MKKKRTEIKNPVFNLHSFNERFPNEEACREYLIKERYPDGKIVCPKCATFNKIYGLKDGKRYKCGNCKHIFTITVGTIFEASHVPLKKWFLAIYIISAHKKGISSLQLHRDIGVTQKTAWFMLHRIRYMLSNGVTKQLLGGEVEIDECYFGGRESNKHRSKRIPRSQGGRNPISKTPILGMLERNGNIVTMPVSEAIGPVTNKIIFNKVAHGSTVLTDQNTIYNYLCQYYIHSVVNHSVGEYVRGNVHTNSIEGYWGLLKRGIIGIYHYVSPKHLHRYCDEYQYRYNTRKIEDAERFQKMFAHSNARLKYAKLIEEK